MRHSSHRRIPADRVDGERARADIDRTRATRRAVAAIAQPVLARAIDGIAHLVGRVRARADFSVADVAEVTDIQRDLEALRRDAVGAAAGDAETAAAEVARREEETPADGPSRMRRRKCRPSRCRRSKLLN